MKHRKSTFALIGGLLVSLFMFLINITTSFAHPWFIYPTFAIMWWPMAVFFGSIKNGRALSVTGAAWTSLFFITVNMVTSPTYLWFIYPVFAVLWWPVSLILCSRGKYKLFSVVGALMASGFFILVNYITTPGTLWFIYPVFAVLWWPLCYLICSAKMYKLFSVIASGYIILFFFVLNLLLTPTYIWFFYPAFVVIWWPLSMFFAKKKTIKLYSVIMSLTIIGFLALTNFLNSPDVMWFQYTIFYLLVWPAATLLGEKAKTLAFSLTASVLIILYNILLYYMLTPLGYPWFLQTIMPVIWWPVCVAFKSKIRSIEFLLTSVTVFLAYYIIVNMILTPSLVLIPCLVYVALWVLMGVYFGESKKYFALSLCAAATTIAFFTALNLLTTPNIIWAVYPSFAIIWWPLSLYFFKVRKRNA